MISKATNLVGESMSSEDEKHEDEKSQENSKSEQAKEYFNEFYEKLERFAKTTNTSFKNEILPEIEKKAKQNPLLSVFISFCAGILVSFLIGRRFHRD